ncbi:aldehyde dehydrogenase [Natronorubrum tibetense GA33]|uniref:Aldehyde dehydrogenase n=1 Tax=Natronorubrum tibetense GA33 TaxID=1114856 RepID=L9VRZ9_9EURY|nr:aldehyde dehydrogenase [Natronorubrum tibetense GA33]
MVAVSDTWIGPLDAPPGVSPRWFARFMIGLTKLQRRLTRWLP